MCGYIVTADWGVRIAGLTAKAKTSAKSTTKYIFKNISEIEASCTCTARSKVWIHACMTELIVSGTFLRVR